MNTSTSRDRLWRKRLNELSAVWPDFVSGRTGGLHKTRVASRRIREALPIVGADARAGEGEEAQQENARADALARTYPRARRRARHPGRQVEDRRRVRAARIEMVRREVASRRQVLRDEIADHAPVGDLKKLLKKLERVGATGKAGKREEGRGKKSKGRRLRASSKRNGAACSRRG